MFGSLRPPSISRLRRWGGGSRVGARSSRAVTKGRPLSSPHVDSRSRRAQLLGTAGGVKRMATEFAKVDETFLVLSSDALTDINLKRLVSFHKKKQMLCYRLSQISYSKNFSSWSSSFSILPVRGLAATILALALILTPLGYWLGINWVWAKNIARNKLVREQE